jgi:hypothetical protein
MINTYYLAILWSTQPLRDPSVTDIGIYLPAPERLRHMNPRTVLSPSTLQISDTMWPRESIHTREIAVASNENP